MKDIFVVFKDGQADIKGDSTDAFYGPKSAIEVSSWRHKITQPKSSTASTAGGHTAERTEHGEMIFTKEIDKASPKIWQAASAGTYYDKVEIFFYRAQGGVNSSNTTATQQRINYLKIELKSVIVSSVDTNVGDSELPTEVFGLKYASVQWTYLVAKVEGGPGVAGASGAWNLKNNTPVY
jgi:type VI secretion system secreted protein Hcp